MAFDAEQIEVALFNLIAPLAKAAGFKTVQRQARLFSDVPPATDQPALFLFPLGPRVTFEGYGMPKIECHYLALCYSRSDAVRDPNGLPSQTILNNFLTALIAVTTKTFPQGWKQNLGGLVDEVTIDGDCPMQTGVLDQQCGMEIPFRAITGV